MEAIRWRYAQFTHAGESWQVRGHGGVFEYTPIPMSLDAKWRSCNSIMVCGEGTAEFRAKMRQAIKAIDRASADNIWVVYSQHAKLFWSNDDGWVSLDAATRFDAEDHRKVKLPTGGRWMRLSEALAIHFDGDHA